MQTKTDSRYLVLAFSFALFCIQSLQAGPTIQVQPISRTVAQGEPVTLSVQAVGSGTLTYQWQKDGVSIPGATSATLTISSIKPWHVGLTSVQFMVQAK